MNPDRRDLQSRKALRRRISNEFREIPGLCLTLQQASRLFGVPEAMCQRLLSSLVEARVVQRSGSYYGAWRSDFIGANFLGQARHRHYR